MHYGRLRTNGDVGPAQPMRAPSGTGTIDAYGYRYFVVGGKRVPEHRMVMERVLGRPLLPSENVHHINGQRADNRPENLELWTRSQPSGQRVVDKVAWAVELLETYAPELLAAKPTQLRLVS